jgi:hypothetical protein
MAGLKWNTGKLYYSTVELGYQQTTPMISRDYVSTFELGPFSATANEKHETLPVASFNIYLFTFMHTAQISMLHFSRWRVSGYYQLPAFF